MYYLRKTNIKILQTIKAVEKANNGNKESVPVWPPKASKLSKPTKQSKNITQQTETVEKSFIIDIEPVTI